MRVSDLIECLKECDGDARVYIGAQPAWPFEWSIDGVVKREDFIGEIDEDSGEQKKTDEEIEDELTDGMRLSDVFILEGAQIRYGNRAMWENCERYFDDI